MFCSCVNESTFFSFFRSLLRENGRSLRWPFRERKLFEKKKGIFDGKRIFDWRTSPKYLNLWLVRFDPISQGEHKREWGTLFSLRKPQNDFLYKTDLSRRLLSFHQTGDVVYAQTMESLLSRFLNLHGATICSLLKQTALDNIVDNMKKFQELAQQNMINELFSRSASFCW